MGAAGSAEFAVSPPLRRGFSPLPRLLPTPSAGFLEPPSGLQLRAELQRQHIRASSTSVRVCFLNRKNPFPQMGGSRASLLRGVGPAAPPPPPFAPHPRPGIDPACCVHCISPNGLADDSTSFSLKAAPRFSPLLRLRLPRPRRPLRGRLGLALSGPSAPGAPAPGARAAAPRAQSPWAERAPRGRD